MPRFLAGLGTKLGVDLVVPGFIISAGVVMIRGSPSFELSAACGASPWKK